MESIEQVITLFKKEFSFISEQFNTFELLISDASNDGTEEINCSGVYVFWNPKFGVIKVGKSQSNSKKRALQYLIDNTANNILEMKNLKNEPDTKLLLINIKVSPCTGY